MELPVPFVSEVRTRGCRNALRTSETGHWWKNWGWRRSVATIRMQLQAFVLVLRKLMASLDSVSIAILLGAVLVMAGILSSLLALRFGAPLLLVFLVIGMLAGASGPRLVRFDDVPPPYLVA